MRLGLVVALAAASVLAAHLGHVGHVGCARREVSTTGTRSGMIAGNGVAWRPRVEIARGPATRGPWIQNDSDYRWVDDPAVQLAPDGDAIVAWVDQREKDILLGRWTREGAPRTKTPVNVSASPATFSWLPRVVAHGDDVDVLWQEIVFSGGTHGGEIMFATSRDGGRTFAPPVNLSNSIAGDGKGRISANEWDNGSLDLARGPRGERYATWTEYEGALWLRRSDDGGASFEGAVRVGGTRDRPARAPANAVAPDARGHLAWAIGEDDGAQIHRSTSLDRGATFAAPSLVGRSERRCDAPCLEIDATGRAHLVYLDGGRVAYVRGSDPPRWLSGEGARRPHVAVDGAILFVLYEREASPRGRTQSLLLAHSRDGGDTFAEAPVLGIAGRSLGWNASQQGTLLEKLAVAPNGGEVAIVNGTFLPDRESHIWLLRGTLR
jgi:hypothetical protein